MRDYIPDLTNKTTAFFTQADAKQVLAEITEALDKHETAYELSPKSWKLTFKKRRETLTTR